MSSWLDTVADYVDTVFGRVPESQNIRTPNDIIRQYDTPMPLTEPTIERTKRNVKGVSKKIKEKVIKIGKQAGELALEVITPTLSHEGPVGQGPRVLERQRPIRRPVVRPVIKPRVTTILPVKDGTIQQSPVMAGAPTIENLKGIGSKDENIPYTPSLSLEAKAEPSKELVVYTPPFGQGPVKGTDDTSKSVVVYTPPTIKSVQESVPAVLVPDNIDPETIMKYIKKQSNLRKGRYNPHILNNQSIVEQARIAGLASFSKLRK